MPRARQLPAIKSKAWWTVVCAYAAVVFLLSVLPFHGGLADVPRLDKVVHVSEYLVFAVLLVLAFRSTSPSESGPLWWAWVYASSYGVLMELIQIMIPWRSAEVSDALANAVGAAAGVWVGHRIRQRGRPMMYHDGAP